MGQDTAARLLALGAATLGETGGLPCDPRLRAAWQGARVAAPACTAACPDGDNLALHVAVTVASPGSVLVGRASGDLGNWGEVLTTGALARGLVGLVLDGGVRDVDSLQQRGFPVFATAICLPGACKVGPGTVGGEVEVGGVLVRQGDWIVADADGVVVVPAARMEEVLAAGTARAAAEARLFTELDAGATTVDLLGLDPAAIEVLVPVTAAVDGDGLSPGARP